MTKTAPATRRGDRDARQRDILAAAGDLLAERAWADFAIRDVANRAGLSAGAVYQYFDTKQDIYAALYTERLRRQLARIEAVDPGITLRDLLALIVADMAEIYARVGRHQLAWAAERGEPTATVKWLGATFQSLAAAVAAAIDAAAAREGRTLVHGPAFLPFLWAMCNGVGDQLIDDRYRLHGAGRAEFLAFTADAMARALIAPGEAPAPKDPT